MKSSRLIQVSLQWHLALCLILVSLLPCQAFQPPRMVLQLGNPFDPIAQYVTAAHAPWMAVTASGGVQIWNTQTWELWRTIRTRPASVDFASVPTALSPDGSLLAVVTSTDMLQLWDRKTGRLRRVIPHVRSSQPLFSPTGTLVATADAQAHTTFWDVRTGQPRYSVPSYGDCALSPDGHVLAMITGDQARQVMLWNVQTGRELHALSDAGSTVWGSPIFSPDGRFVAACGLQPHWHPGPARVLPPGVELPSSVTAQVHPRSVLIWNARTGRRVFALHTIQTPSPPLFISDHVLLDFDTRTRWILSGRHARAEKLPAWNRIYPLRGDLAAMPTYPTRSNTPNGVTLMNLKTGWRHRIPKVFVDDDRERPQGVAAFSPNGRVLFLNDQLWSYPAGPLIRRLPLDTVSPSFFLPDGRMLVVMEGRIADLWDWHTGRIVRHITGGLPLSDTSINNPNLRSQMLDDASLVLSPNGEVAVLRAGSPFGTTAKVLNAATNQTLQILQGMDQRLYQAIISPNNQLLANASGITGIAQSPPSVKIWNLHTGHVQATVPSLSTFPGPFLFSPDSQTLAIADNAHQTPWSGLPDPMFLTNTLQWINVATGNVEHMLDFGDRAVTQLVYSHNGRLLAVGLNGEIALYRTTDGQLLRTFHDRSAPVTFSPDDEQIVTAAGEILRVRDGRQIATLISLTSDSPGRPCWLITTPSGYYMASPSASQYIRWRVGDKLYPANHFAARYENPAVIRRALTGH